MPISGRPVCATQDCHHPHSGLVQITQQVSLLPDRQSSVPGFAVSGVQQHSLNFRPSLPLGWMPLGRAPPAHPLRHPCTWEFDLTELVLPRHSQPTRPLGACAPHCVGFIHLIAAKASSIALLNTGT